MFKQISQALWTERELLEQLLFKIEEELALVEQGRTQWVQRCLDEITGVLGRLDEAEATRREVWATVAKDLGIGEDSSLKDMINKVAFPWDSIFNEHQRALSQAARECQTAAAADSERLAATGAADIAKRLPFLAARAA